MTYHCNDCGLDFSETEPAERAEMSGFGKCPRCGGDNVHSPLEGMPPPTKGPLEAVSEDEPEPVPEPDPPADKVPPTKLPKGSKPAPQEPKAPGIGSDPPGKVG